MRPHTQTHRATHSRERRAAQMDLVNEGVDAAKVAAQHEQRKRYAEAAYLYGVAAQLVREATLSLLNFSAKTATAFLIPS